MNENTVIETKNVYKIFGKKDNKVVALNNISLQIPKNKFTVIMGSSGCGKSTLMHCLAGLDSPTEGEIYVDNKCISNFSQSKLTKFRRENISFIFQSFNLLPMLNAKENILLVNQISNKKADKNLLNTIVKELGIENRLKHKPSQLSGGQQQKVACARALMQDSLVLFADEPTGNLDSHSSKQVLDYLRHCVDNLNQTIVMVTHELDAALYGDLVLFMKDGQVIDSLENPTRQVLIEKLNFITQ